MFSSLIFNLTGKILHGFVLETRLFLKNLVPLVFSHYGTTITCKTTEKTSDVLQIKIGNKLA